MKDEIVDEIRKIRHEIEEEYGDDPKRYLEYIYETQKKHGDKLVCRKPKRLTRKRMAL